MNVLKRIKNESENVMKRIRNGDDSENGNDTETTFAAMADKIATNTLKQHDPKEASDEVKSTRHPTSSYDVFDEHQEQAAAKEFRTSESIQVSDSTTASGSGSGNGTVGVEQEQKFDCIHGLAQFTTETDFSFFCDCCGEDQPNGQTMFGCRECDYDVCSTCFEAGRRHRNNISTGTVDVDDGKPADTSTAEGVLADNGAPITLFGANAKGSTTDNGASVPISLSGVDAETKCFCGYSGGPEAMARHFMHQYNYDPRQHFPVTNDATSTEFSTMLEVDGSGSDVADDDIYEETVKIASEVQNTLVDFLVSLCTIFSFGGLVPPLLVMAPFSVSAYAQFLVKQIEELSTGWSRCTCSLVLCNGCAHRVGRLTKYTIPWQSGVD